MSNITFDIATLLENNGYGIIGTDIFVSEDHPAKPDKVLVIKNLGTVVPDHPTIDMSYLSIQIMFRESKGGYQNCEKKAFEVNNFLKTIANEQVNDTILIFINHQSGPVSIGMDTTMRPLYSLNMICLRTDK